MINKDEKKQAVLTKLGFNSSEAKIYLTLSKLGPSTVKIVAKTARLDRGETYRVITKLEEKGFLQKILAYPVKFKAIPIADLLPVLIQEKKNEVNVIEKEAKQLLDQDKDTYYQLKQEYIVYIPQVGKAFEEILREIESVKKIFSPLNRLKLTKRLHNCRGKIPGQSYLKKALSISKL